MNTHFQAHVTLPRRFGWWTALVFVTGMGFTPSAGTPSAAAQDAPRAAEKLADDVQVDFAVDIMPILKQNCLACHHQKEAEDQAECEHGYVLGRGCRTCEFYERADYEYERSMDR